MEPVGKMLDVTITPLAGGEYFVEAVCQVGNGGYSKPRLVSRGGAITSDGNLEYDFMAQPAPRGTFTAQVITKLVATANFGGPGTDLRGLRRVRVHSASNYLDRPLPQD